MHFGSFFPQFSRRSLTGRPRIWDADRGGLGYGTHFLSLFWTFVRGRLSGRPRFWGSLGVILAVLVLCRGLIFGRGGFEIYVDSGLPASDVLMRGICQHVLTLWTPTNLGDRVLYPSEYLVCGPIVGALNLGVPAWAISRFLPIASLALAAWGMFRLLIAISGSLPRRVRDTQKDTVAAAGLAAVLYACSAYAFTELVAGHFLYLIALAAFPLAALLLYETRSSALAVVLGGLLLAFAGVQVQFVLLAPLALFLMAWILQSWRLAIRCVAASIMSILPHLPWLIPLLIYPPRISIAAYLLPGTDTKFSMNPLDSLRLVGYVTPFAELAVASWFAIWQVLSFLLLAVAGIGLVFLKRKRAAWLLLAIGLITYYQWGARAPAYSLWQGLVPLPIQGLFRERFVLSFLTLVALTVLFYLGARYLLGRWRAPAWIILVPAMLGILGPFLDGHLGPFGVVREEFVAETKVTNYIAAHGGGAVMTVPFGSVVRASDWAYLGRSPFSIGGPPTILDTENAPNAAAVPMVRATSGLLNRPLGPDVSLLREYLSLLHVHFVADWLRFVGDVPLDRGTVEANLAQLGAQRVLQNDQLILWELPGVNSPPQIVTAERLFVSSGIHAGALAGADTWGAALAISNRGNGSDVLEAAKASSGSIHLTRRKLTVHRSGAFVSIIEPILQATNGRLYDATMRLEVPIDSKSGGLAFGDGTPIPLGDSSPIVSGPVDRVYASRTEAVIGNERLIQSSSLVQDTNNVNGLSLAAAGISSLVVGQPRSENAVSLQARHDQAGLPIQLPVFPGSHYSLSLQLMKQSGPQAHLSIVADRSNHLLTMDAPSLPGWQTVELGFDAPIVLRELYLYIYVDAPQSGTSLSLARRLQGQVTTALGLSAVQAISVTLQTATGPSALAGDPVIDRPSLTAAAASVQDTANIDHISLDAAGIRASTVPGPGNLPAVEVSARRDEAGLPILLPLQRTSSYQITVRTRHVAGPGARLAVVANGNTIVTSQDLPLAEQWRTTELHFVPPSDAGDLYLYMYVSGTSSASESSEQISDASVVMRPLFPDVVLDANLPAGACVGSLCRRESLKWALASRGTDSWWRVPNSLERVQLAGDGFADIWLVRGGTANPQFLPNQAFTTIFSWLIGLMTVAAILAAIVWAALARWPAGYKYLGSVAALVTNPRKRKSAEVNDTPERSVVTSAGSARDPRH